jgi:hypothetical protein
VYILPLLSWEILCVVCHSFLNRYEIRCHHHRRWNINFKPMTLWGRALRLILSFIRWLLLF